MNSKTTKKDEPVRFIPVGGFEEIGRNMMAFEYKDEIILIDMGLQFPEEETPGIDFIIPILLTSNRKDKTSRRSF
jgi:ribonuclease J